MGLVVRDVHKRWPGGCIVFRALNELHELNAAETALFQNAMNHWASSADVRFVERTTQDCFVTFMPDVNPLDGVNNSSAVGMAGGEQFIRIDPIIPGVGRTHASRHEVGHALGMFHEQQRRDRANSIAINQGAIKPERVHDFEKVNASDGMPVGAYDIGSIMHYSASKGASIDGNTVIITKADGSALPPRANAISGGDVQSAAELNRGNLHIYQLTNNGQIEKTITQTTFPSGVTTVVPYTLDTRQFLLFVKKNGGSGALRARNMNLDGSLGTQVQSNTVTSGWTSVATYGVLGASFALMYKAGTGDIKLRRINFDGTLEPSATSVGGQLETGWTSVRHYAVGVDNFLLFANANTGEVRVRRVGADGQPHDVIQSTTWTTGWTTVRPFSTGSGNLLFKLKAGNGTMHVERINNNGTLGGILDNRTFPTGLDVAIPYNVAGGAFVLLLNSSKGLMEIRRIKQDGKTGALTDSRRFSADWDTAAVFTVGLGTYVVLIKSGT